MMFRKNCLVLKMEFCSLKTLYLITCILYTYCQQTTAISCYQCNSNEHTYCAEIFNPEHLNITETPCDAIYEANYCIKTTGMYEGTIGTRRSCSSRHHGNYCEYVTRPGDDREYRSCVYTCYRDGCNSANAFALSTSIFFLILLIWTRSFMLTTNI